MTGFMHAGAVVFDYGNNIRAQARLRAWRTLSRSLASRRRSSGHSSAKGKGPFRWAALSGDPADIAALDDALLETFPDDESLAALDRAGARAREVPGIAGAHLLARLRRAAHVRAAHQRDGALRRAGSADRHRARSLDAGSVASPYRETEA